MTDTDRPGLARLREIQERCNKATEGPWAYEAVSDKSNEWCLGVVVGNDDKPLSGRVEQGQGIIDHAIVREAMGLEDAAFIAHAREDIPYLLQRVAECEAALAAPSQLESKNLHESRSPDGDGQCRDTGIADD